MALEAKGKPAGAVDAIADLIRSLRLWYERITLSFVFSSTWWALGFMAAQLVLASPVLVIPAAGLLAAGSAMTLSMANKAVHLEDFELKAFLKEALTRYLRYFGLFAAASAALILYIPLMLYLPTVGGFWAFAGFGIAAWVGLFCFISVTYAAGIIAERDERLIKALVKGFLLMMDNPGYSLTSGVVMLFLAIVGYLLPLASIAWSSWAYMVLVVVGVFLFGAVNAFYVSYAVRRLLARYGLDRKSGREALEEELGQGLGSKAP